jgi:hypothetical protein
MMNETLVNADQEVQRRDSQGKTRPLHVEESLALIDPKAGPVHPNRATGYPQPGKEGAAMAVWQSLVWCHFFHLDYALKQQPCGQENLFPGDTLLPSAALPEVMVSPRGPLGLLVSTLPEPSATA